MKMKRKLITKIKIKCKYFFEKSLYCNYLLKRKERRINIYSSPSVRNLKLKKVDIKLFKWPISLFIKVSSDIENIIIDNKI